MARPETRMTYEDFRRLPEGPPYYELIGGELFLSPAPTTRHQRIVRELSTALHSFARVHGLGEVFFAPVDVVLSDEDIVEPDILFVAKNRLDIVQEDGVHGAPDFIVEVLSPSDPSRDRERKRDLYQARGVREYWIVDPQRRTIEVLLHDGAKFNRAGTFRPDDRIRSVAVTGFEEKVAEFLSPER